MGSGKDHVRRRVVVTGRVQGVFYRQSCRDRAVALGLVGSVVNRADGRVEAVVEGQPAAVEALVTWCRTGPPSASVTGVEVTVEEPVGQTGFTVG